VHADDRLLPWIVARRLAEDVEPDRVFLQVLRLAGQGLLGEVVQQVAVDFGGLERLAGDDALDLDAALGTITEDLTRDWGLGTGDWGLGTT